jgi:hypothetical protein
VKPHRTASELTRETLGEDLEGYGRVVYVLPGRGKIEQRVALEPKNEAA